MAYYESDEDVRNTWLAEINDLPTEMTLVLIGSPGSGKSSTANTIFGEKHWKTSCQSEKVTETIQGRRVNRNGINLTVIDTPGFSSIDDWRKLITGIDNMNMKNVIYGITLRIGRTTDKEIAVLNTLLTNINTFEYLRNQTLFIFTSKDELVDIDSDPSDSMMLDEESLDEKFIEWIENSPKLRSLIEVGNFECGVISNRLAKENRNEESNRLIAKLNVVLTACSKHERKKLCQIGDFPLEKRLDEVFQFTLREIRDLMNDVRFNEKFTFNLSIKQPGYRKEMTKMTIQLISNKIKEKGSTLTEQEVVQVFNPEYTCAIS